MSKIKLGGMFITEMGCCVYATIYKNVKRK